jgi:hypothetical protein
MEGKKAEIVGGKRVVRNNGPKRNEEGEQQGAGMEGINDR